MVVLNIRGVNGGNTQIEETRPLTPADIEWAAAVVTRSFFRDWVWSGCFPMMTSVTAWVW